MATVLGANTLSSGGYQVDNSCRFNGDAYVHKAVVAGNQRTFTYSFWTKRSTLNGYQTFIGYAQSAGGGGSTNRGELIFVGDGDDTLRVGFNPGGSSWSNYTVSDKVFRDTSAWYNIVLKVNTTNGTNTERLKIFVNGVSQGLDGYPGQNFDTGFNVDGYVYHVGRSASGTGNFLKGYLAEAVFIDGTALDADSFGEFDEDSGIWKPIDVSGLTFGNNGFHLDFEASGNLGNDANGGTDFTEVSLAATDQSTDTCTNNFCTMNALDNFYAASTLSEGNLKVLTISGNAAYNPATFGLIKGKWYWEIKLVTCSNGDGSEATIIGISNQSPVNAGYSGSIVVNDGIGIRGNGKAWGADGSSGGGQETSGWDAIAVGNTAMIAVDFDNGKLYHGINGTWGNSGDPTSGSSGTGAYAFTVGTDVWFPGVNQRETSQTATFELNFGSPPYAISSGNQDADGFGNFEYAVPSGYFSINTKNLAEYG